MKLDLCYQLMNEWTVQKTPFLFVIDFEKKQPLLYKLSELDSTDSPIFYHFPKLNNNQYFNTENKHNSPCVQSKHNDEEKAGYLKRFEQAQSLLKSENVEVINLTKATPLNVEGSLSAIYCKANAKYKVLLKDKFVCCSPEIFIRVDENGVLSTNPMKGTIDANIPNADTIIIENIKEELEHRATVNLLTEELKEVATNVSVKRYRYLDRLTTSDKDLYQVSSEIVGELNPEYQKNLGTLINQLLPAGSILGNPKEKALQIIQSVEEYERGYYTGVCGVFDGQTLDCCVLIRFIEQLQNGEFIYKSGGGITPRSNGEDEFQEILNKIYVPLD